MGRLIDIDVLFDYFGNDAITETTRSNIEYFVREKGTVEAISKDQYEARLKSDMIAMLTEIQLEIEGKHKEEDFMNDWSSGYNIGLIDTSDLIQQKINALKEE